MSLINEMLRDLDQRQATAAERAGLASQVRALPPERGFPWLRLLPLFAGVLLGAGGIGFFLESRSMPSAEARSVAPEPAVAASPMAMPSLVVPMPRDLPEPAEADATMEPPAGSVDPPPAAASRRGGAESFQIDFSLSRPIQPIQPMRVPPRQAVAATVPPPAIDKRPAAPAADTAEGEHRRAMAAYREGRITEALAGFEAALRTDPRHIAARQAMLSLLMEQRRWPQAQAVAADGLALDATQAGWAMILARLQIEQGQVAEAEQTMARHAAHGERSPDYLAFHALLLQRLQRPKEAAERYLAAAVLRPGEGRWWYGLGVALDADQRAQEARDAFRKAKESGNLPPELAAAADRRLR